MRHRIAVMVAWLVLAPGARAQALACLIEPDRVAELGSPVIGVLEEVRVERGARVRRGEVVAVLQAGVERSSLDMAHVKMQADAELSAAQANLDLARRKQERTESLVAQNFLSSQALDQARTEAEIAQRTVARAEEQRRLAQREWQVAQAQLAQRVIRSPIDGVVVEKYLSAGERVDERPIAKIAAIDPLRVEVVVPAVHYSKFKPGLAGAVVPDLPGADAHRAVVTLVDGVIDAASNTFRVRLQLDNADRSVPAGARCKVSFEGVELPVTTAVRPVALDPARAVVQ